MWIHGVKVLTDVDTWCKGTYLLGYMVQRYLLMWIHGVKVLTDVDTWCKGTY